IETAGDIEDALSAVSAIRNIPRADDPETDVFLSLDGIVIGATLFQNGNLSNVFFNQSRWTSTVLQRMKFRLTWWSSANMFGVSFNSCDLEDASFAHTELEHLTFIDCNMTHTSFAGAKIGKGMRLDSCNVSGADLKAATDADLIEFDNCWA